jgi:hypothetical protein
MPSRGIGASPRWRATGRHNVPGVDIFVRAAVRIGWNVTGGDSGFVTSAAYGESSPIYRSGRMPSFFMRLYRVAGLSPRTAAAPCGPLMCPPACSSTRRMCWRSASAAVCGGAAMVSSSAGTVSVSPTVMALWLTAGLSAPYTWSLQASPRASEMCGTPDAEGPRQFWPLPEVASCRNYRPAAKR